MAVPYPKILIQISVEMYWAFLVLTQAKLKKLLWGDLIDQRIFYDYFLTQVNQIDKSDIDLYLLK